jgi:hypothetical protein
MGLLEQAVPSMRAGVDDGGRPGYYNSTDAEWLADYAKLKGGEQAVAVREWRSIPQCGHCGASACDCKNWAQGSQAYREKRSNKKAED